MTNPAVSSKSKIENRKSKVVTLVWLCAALLLSLFPATSRAADFANDVFAKAYAANPALWGAPGQQLTEMYVNTPGGQRQVQYFDKGRMEWTYPDSQPTFIGNGKLVTEMVTGRVQVGDTLYWQYDGAESPVAGGATFGANPGAPSYRSFQSLVRAVPSQVGKPISAVLTTPEGEGYFLGIPTLANDSALGSLVKNAAYIPETGHNVPDVFWRYLNQPGPQGLPAFNWETVFGLPITDSYWAKVRDGASVRDVLVQLFERRTLLYDPANGGTVDSGLVGRDYYRWRYELPELPVVDTTFTPPDSSSNVTVTPAIGESGTIFRLDAQGFQPGEKVDIYVRLKNGGGIFSQGTFPANGQGHVILRARTSPLYSPTDEYYVVYTGLSSGVHGLAHYKVIGSIRYTPAVEASQPGDVPLPTANATLDKTLIRVGETANLTAPGFLPGEYLKGWITTPLNRVVGWVGLVNSFSTVGRQNLLLQADKSGVLRLKLPAPGAAEPGIYAFTLFGPQSNRTAIVYFRVKTGSAYYFDPGWGLLDFEVKPRPASAQPVDLPSLSQNPAAYRQLLPQLEQEQ